MYDQLRPKEETAGSQAMRRLTNPPVRLIVYGGAPPLPLASGTPRAPWAVFFDMPGCPHGLGSGSVNRRQWVRLPPSADMPV